MINKYCYWKHNSYWKRSNYYLINKYRTNSYFFDPKNTNLNDISINISLRNTKSYTLQVNSERNAYPTR